MFSFTIRTVNVLFSKFFSAADSAAVLAAIPAGTRRVVFIDTPATAALVATIEAILKKGMEVVVRDHHDAPARSNPREVEIADAANRVRQLCGGNAVISDRQKHPACSTLLQTGEFASEGTVIVADADADGLTAAVKAAGVTYDRLDADAAVLDGPRSGQSPATLSPLALLLVRAMSTLPAFDRDRPQVSEDAKGRLFADFVAVVEGDTTARTRLERGVEVYEMSVKEAERLAATVTEPIPGLGFVDATAAVRFDLATLASKMESRPGAKVTVQKKAIGPIAAKHGGVQYSLMVVPAHQKAINLQGILPSGFVSSPESGIISNTTFMLHVSEKVWDEAVLPGLRAILAK